MQSLIQYSTHIINKYLQHHMKSYYDKIIINLNYFAQQKYIGKY